MPEKPLKEHAPSPAKADAPESSYAHRLFLALERILRQLANGHPVGHDAILIARRALISAAPEVVGRSPYLRCNCTPCVLAREAGRNVIAARPEAQEPSTVSKEKG